MNSEWLSASAFANIDLVDEMYEKYLSSPKSVNDAWRQLFQQFDSSHPPEKRRPTEPSAHADLRIAHLVNAYRSYGHLSAKVNPLVEGSGGEEPWQLNLNQLGFNDEELQLPFPTLGFLPESRAPLKEIVEALKSTYCGKIGIEYMNTQNPRLERWLQKEIEPTHFKISLTIEEKQMILEQLNRCELLEKFLHTKYVGQKRFSLEGGETLIPILSTIIEKGADSGLSDFIIGMAHRGRLNVLSNILNKSYENIFSEFEDRYLPNSIEGSGDVKYHKGFSSSVATRHGHTVKVSLCPNPSHLEAVNPVVEGMARALQVKGGKVLPILIHGDAAISGQGVIYETLQLYNLDQYSTGGTLHIVINNQIGFTTDPSAARSTYYCTDIARAFCAPVFHVNGEDPEGCLYATALALAIRQQFQCDVFIDLYCYRKYGHNESDEPAYTQPLEYRIIREKKPVRELYRDSLIEQGVVEKHVAETLEEQFKSQLQERLDSVKELESHPPVPQRNDNLYPPVNTAVDKESLLRIAQALTAIPSSFSAHKKVEALFADRLAMAKGEKPIDWGMGELLAYATLLDQGIPVRLAGQDSGRGTFSHRHALIKDQKNGASYIPLQHLSSSQARCDIVNTPLSEYAALGFEYGYNLGCPEGLTLWEAQFGDFANGGQVIIDQFLVNSEQKWGQKSSLVLLLPHGYEGQGPEHSSARIERFLTLAGNNNIFAVNPTTPAQLFHLLRRQMLGGWQKPLIVFTPKGLLRHPQCVSSLGAFTEGGFQELIDDEEGDPSQVETLLFCSGRYYYELAAERKERQAHSTAIVRIEQLCPVDGEAIQKIIQKYSNAKECLWVQEEPLNMGAWTFMRPHLEALLPEATPLGVIARPSSAASAPGSLTLHKEGHREIIETLFHAEKRQARSPQ